jgi:hypothetical protein
LLSLSWLFVELAVFRCVVAFCPASSGMQAGILGSK